jgi:hypothetical protein
MKPDFVSLIALMALDFTEGHSSCPVCSPSRASLMTGKHLLLAAPEQHIDGVGLVPLLKSGEICRRMLFWHYPHYGNQGGAPCGFVRDGDWKLIEWYEDHAL